MPVVVLKGDDEILMSQAVQTLISELLGDADRSLAVEEIGEDNYLASGVPSLAPLVLAAQTPPFLSPKRIVIGRNLAIFTKAEQWESFIELLTSLHEQVDLVLVWEKGSSSQRLGAIPKKLSTALKTSQADVRQVSPSGKARKSAVVDLLKSCEINLTPQASKLVLDTYGDDLGRLSGFVDVLERSFDPSTLLDEEAVGPFLGHKSDVPPWELTDAIEQGNIAVALEKLDRMSSARHPLQILAVLHNHFQRCLALDGSGISDERSAADILGMTGSTFPAKKALALTRKLGTQKVSNCIDLIGQADLDLRGASGLPQNVVVEVLVARLARLSSA